MEHNASDVQHNGGIQNSTRAYSRPSELWTVPLRLRPKVSSMSNLTIAIAMESPDFQVIKRARDNEFDSHASHHRLIPLWTLEQSGCTTDKQSFSQNFSYSKITVKNSN